MDRRKFLHTLNANVIGAILPASLLSEDFTHRTTQMAVPPRISLLTVIEDAATTWDIPKIGIVTVGGVGRACRLKVVDRMRSLPYLSRTIEVDSCGGELHALNAQRKLQVSEGNSLVISHTDGLPDESSIDQIANAVFGLDMVLLVAGMDDTTGTTIAAIAAVLLRKQEIPTLAFVVMPFEGDDVQRQHIAQAGLRELRTHVDAVIPFFNAFSEGIDSNAKMGRSERATPQLARLAFNEVCRSILLSACGGGYVAIDFEDIRHIIMRQDGDCAFGFGTAKTPDGAATAARRAIDHPSLGQDRLKRASAALVSISGTPNVLNLHESSDAFRTVRRQLPPNAYVIYGAHVVETPGHDFAVSILANGIT